MKLPFQKPAAPAARRRATADSRAPVYSYHARRSTEQRTTASSRQMLRSVLNAENTSRVARYSFRRIGVIAVLVAGIVSIFSVFSLTPNPKVLPLDNTDTGGMYNAAAYEAALRRLMAASPASRTKLTINTAVLSAGLEAQFPEIAGVSVKLPLIGHRPIVYIQLAQPVVALRMTDGHTVAIDARGRSLGPAGPSLGLPVVKDESGTVVQPGRQALPVTTVDFIQSVLFQLRQKRVGVTTFVLPAGSSELDVYLEGAAYHIKCNLAMNNTVQEQIGTFLAVQHQLAEQGSLPRQYIDVRVAGRAYYK